MATFSLVASACRSTTIVSASCCACSTRPSTTRNGDIPELRKSSPARLITATSPPPRAGRTVSPRPGAPAG